jgi:hypothetical protein
LENFSFTAIENKITNKQELISMFPEDIFHYINDQIQLLGGRLKPELFIEFIREVCDKISYIQSDLQNQMSQEVMANYKD